MSVYFASDLHLKALDDSNVERFFAFLDEVRADGEALYLLGDIFEAYIGDDDDDPLVARVAAELSTLNCAVFLVHGNRDFLIGQSFATRAAATLLGEETVIKLGSFRALLLHGDTLCTDDIAYQHVRTQLRSRQWQSDFLNQPLAARRAFAVKARAESRMHTAGSAADIMDANSAAVNETLTRHEVLLLIHGHTHRPMVHRHGNATRIVLPDWDEHRSWLKWTAETGELYARGQCERVDV